MYVARERERERERESPQLCICRVNPARFVIARGGFAFIIRTWFRVSKEKRSSSLVYEIAVINVKISCSSLNIGTCVTQQRNTAFAPRLIRTPVLNCLVQYCQSTFVLKYRYSENRSGNYCTIINLRSRNLFLLRIIITKISRKHRQPLRISRALVCRCV